MVGFIRFFILFVLLIVSSAHGDQHTCKFIRFVGLLDCVNRGLQKVPILKDGRRSVKVLDLRQNNITEISDTVLANYPNLKLVDVRQNPYICGGIHIVNIKVRSSCPITSTAYSPVTPSSTSLSSNTRSVPNTQTQNITRPSPSKSYTLPVPYTLNENTPRSSPSKPHTRTVLSTRSQNTPQSSTSKPHTPSVPEYRNTPQPSPSKPNTPLVTNTKIQNTPRPSPTKPNKSISSSTTFSLPANDSSSSTVPPFNNPTIPVTEYQRSSPDLLVYLSTTVTTILILGLCVKFKFYTRCRRNTRQLEQPTQQNNENIAMSPVSSSSSIENIAMSPVSSSGSSNEVYSITRV